MPYVSLHELCPEVACQETRTITVPPGGALGLPAGRYDFVEMYCDEAGCDCRRVMFSVVSSATMRTEAVVAWGWESLDYYDRWLGMGDRELARAMQGPALELGSPRTADAAAILALAQHLLLSDDVYVARILRHYALFRDQVNGRVRNESTGPRVRWAAAKARKAARKRHRHGKR